MDVARKCIAGRNSFGTSIAAIAVGFNSPEGVITSTIERSHGEDKKNHVFCRLF